MTPLNEFVRDHYGSQKQLAKSLNVAEHTVVRWIKREPHHMMKHAWQMAEEKTPTKSRRMRFIMEMVQTIDQQLSLINGADHE